MRTWVRCTGKSNKSYSSTPTGSLSPTPCRCPFSSSYLRSLLTVTPALFYPSPCKGTCNRTSNRTAWKFAVGSAGPHRCNVGCYSRVGVASTHLLPAPPCSSGMEYKQSHSLLQGCKALQAMRRKHVLSDCRSGEFFIFFYFFEQKEANV